MKRLIIALSLTLLLSGCNANTDPQKYIIDGETLIHCVSKLKGEPSILYYLKDATQYEYENLPVIVTYITDVKGKQISLNNYEMENYVCSEIKKAA